MTKFPWPHFIIGGAPRSGTTYLCHALELHSQICLAKPLVPEPKVFLEPDFDLERARDRYASYFSPEEKGLVRGEKTTNYFENEDAVARMAATLPEVKLIFVVREPVERAYSNWLWSTQNGLETLDFEKAVELEGQRPSPLPPENAHARPFDYLTRGQYDIYARRYLAAFPREAVRFELYEDLIAKTDEVMGRICSHVDVDPGVLEYDRLGVINPSKKKGPELGSELRERLKTRMRESVREFAELTGINVSVWKY